VGGLAEVVVDGVNGLLVPVDSCQDLAEGLIRFYQGEFVASLACGIADRSKKFSWSHLINTIERLAQPDF
jgi:glycosyltransferase involved in cell wall biosynthesis